ncbi:MAG: DoxX family protein [Rubrobacteraceae bacterium]
MRYVTKIPQVLLVPAFLGAGGQKLAATDQMVEEFDRYGYPQWMRAFTGAVEVTGALGMATGFFRPAVTPLAALLLAATMTGALATHIRLGDPAKNLAPPALLLALSAAVLAGSNAGRGSSGP